MYMLDYQVHSPCMTIIRMIQVICSHCFSQVHGNFLRYIEDQGPWTSVICSGACAGLDHVVMPQAGDAFNVCGAVTVVFPNTTLVGIAGATLGVAGVTVNDALGASDRGAAVDAAHSSGLGVTHSLMVAVYIDSNRMKGYKHVTIPKNSWS